MVKRDQQKSTNAHLEAEGVYIYIYESCAAQRN
jgi:hypothetical protein